MLHGDAGSSLNVPRGTAFRKLPGIAQEMLVNLGGLFNSLPSCVRLSTIMEGIVRIAVRNRVILAYPSLMPRRLANPKDQ